MFRNKIDYGILVCLLSLWIYLPSPLYSQSESIDIDSDLQLFLDESLIADSKGAALKLHSPECREVVFTFDAPWEGPESAYVTMLQDGDEYRMYYRAGGENTREYAALATSPDGIHWRRPNLGLFDFNGSKENNIIWSGEKKAYWECHNFSPFIDQKPGCTPEQKFKAVSFIPYDVDGDGENERTLLGYVSSDGIHWKRLRGEPIITQGKGFDSHNVVFWDENLKSYVCYSRTEKDGYRWIQRCISKDFLTWTDYQLLQFDPEPLEHFYTNAIIPYFRNPQVYLGFPMRFVPDRKTIGLDKKAVDALSDAIFIQAAMAFIFPGIFWRRSSGPGAIRIIGVTGMEIKHRHGDFLH